MPGPGEFVRDGAVFDVECVSAAGETLAVCTLNSADLRPVTRAEILYVRDYASL